MTRAHAVRSSLLALATLLAALPMAASPLGCPGFGGEVGAEVSGDASAVRWSSRQCRGELELRGEVSIDASFMPATMRPGSRIEVEERAEGETRRLVAVPGADGRPRIEWSIGGESVPFDEDARAWLGERLALFARQTGYGAAERVAELQRRGGAAAVLAEVARIDNDHVEGLYLERLLDDPALSSADRGRAFAVAAERISGDADLAGLLVHGAGARGFADADAVALAAAAAAVESDADLARVLSVGLAVGGVGSPGRTALLGAARRVRSDADLARLLVAASPRLDFASPDERRAVDGALAGLRSDADLARVLAAFAARRGLAAEGVGLVLDAARRGIASDGDLATLLVEVAARHRLGGDLEERYRAAAATLESDADRRRALAAL